VTCPICSRVLSSDMFVCRECTKIARAHLSSIAKFCAWADDKRARVGSTWSIGGGSRASERPLPFDPRVTKIIQPIHNDLTTWARIVWEDAPRLSDPAGTDTSSIAFWLMTYCGWFATRQDGQDAFQAWERANQSLENLYDRPPEKVYLGRCNASTDFGPCPESLYVEAGDVAAHISCPRCGAAIPVDERRAELAEGVEDYLGTARELSRLLKLVLGEDANPKMIWAYARQGLIHQHGVRVEQDTLGRSREVPTYRIGEVREAASILARDDEQRKAIRRTMRGIVAS
jgi:hypothetical protein